MVIGGGKNREGGRNVREKEKSLGNQEKVRKRVRDKSLVKTDQAKVEVPFVGLS